MADDGTTRGQFLILAPVTNEAQFQPVFLGKVDQFTSEQGFDPTAATYVEDPDNPATSPGLAWVHSTGKSNPDWTAADAMFVVFSNRCMHLGCPVQATSQGFQCPCHGGAYNTVGQRIAGPPIRPLDRFQWVIKNSDELWITQRWSVLLNGDRARYYPVKAPGQALSGQIPAAEALYPAVTYTHGAVPRSR